MTPTNGSGFPYDACFDKEIGTAIDLLLASAHQDTASFVAAHRGLLKLITERVHCAEDTTP